MPSPGSILAHSAHLPSEVGRLRRETDVLRETVGLRWAQVLRNSDFGAAADKLLLGCCCVHAAVACA